MRNNFGARQQNINVPGFDGEQTLEQASSPDQISMVWNVDGEVVTALPMADSGSGAFNLDVARFPSELNLIPALNVRRRNQLAVAPISAQTHFLTSVSDFSERTRILALDGNQLALDDVSLTEWLINAERQVRLGTDNHPVFETSLEDTACTIRRLPNGQVAMTEVPRSQIMAVRDKIHRLLADGSPIKLRVETPLRCAARYFLTALKEGQAVLRAGKEAEVTAFLLITKTGFSYGLWSPATGLFSEYAFLAPTEISQAGNAIGGKADVRVAAYVKRALDQLFLQLSPEKLEQLLLSNYAQVVWASDSSLLQAAAPIVTEYSGQHGMEFFQIPVPVDEAVAGGLLFGSFTFGDRVVAGAEIMPPVDMARDILVFADSEEIERRRLEDLRMLKRRNQTIFALLAAPVAVAAILLAVFADLVRANIMTAWSDSRADARTMELKPALDRRKSYEANLKWYKEFITQVTTLRRQQPVGIGLLYQLNSNYPFDIDPSFFVSDMKVLASGEIEMKGYARNKDSVASFLKSLEFAGGTASGSRLFSNLAYEVQESMPQTAAVPGQAGIPVLSGSTLTTATSAPGVIRWSLKGNYIPMVEFAPPDPKAKPAAAPVLAATPKPAA